MLVLRCLLIGVSLFIQNPLLPFAQATKPAFKVFIRPSRQGVNKHHKRLAILKRVSLNHASAQLLQQTLIGIGYKRAKAIVDYRERHGPFKCIEECLNVPGIGKKLFEKFRVQLIL